VADCNSDGKVPGFMFGVMDAVFRERCSRTVRSPGHFVIPGLACWLSNSVSFADVAKDT